jgi:hypothetical protein
LAGVIVMPTLLCHYAHGAAQPWDLVRGIEAIADLVVVVSGQDAYSQRARHIFESLDVPVYDSPERAKAAAGTIDGVVTYSEQRVVATADLAQRWRLPGMPPETARILRSKRAQRTLLAAAGADAVAHLPVATPHELRDAVHQLGLPVVLKPDQGWGSRATRRIHTDADLTLAVEMLVEDEPGGYIVERFLRGRDELPYGDYVSVEVVMSAGSPVVLAVTGKLPLLPPFREPGQFWPAHLSSAERAALCDFVLRAVRAVGVEVGALHVEVKLCADGPHVIEMNGRLGGFVPELIKAGAGVDLIELAARAALGERLEPLLDERDRGPRRRVRFQHSCLGPPGAVEFVAAPTAKQLARRDGVDFYRVLLAPGTCLSRGVATQEIDLIQAVADDHESMCSMIEDLQHEIVLEFRTAGGAVVPMTGLEIAERNRARPA